MTTASEPISSSLGKTGEILDRIQHYAIKHPSAEEFYIYTELEASQILIEMAAMIKHTAKDIKHKGDRDQYMAISRKYRGAVARSEALQCFTDMTDEDRLELFGLRLVVKPPH